MLALCLGKVGAQVDVGWVYAAGEDPEALLWRIAPLVKSLHYKDFRREGRSSPIAPSGNMTGGWRSTSIRFPQRAAKRSG